VQLHSCLENSNFTATYHLTHPRGPGRPGETRRFVASGSSGTPGNRGAPPRGVDVKPPRSGGPRGPGKPQTGSPDLSGGSSGTGVPGDPRSGVPDPLPRGRGSPWQGPGPLPGSRRALRSPGARGFYINPSRRGPAVPAGPDRGPGVPGRSRRAPGEPAPAPPRRGSQIRPFFRPREPRGPGARG